MNITDKDVKNTEGLEIGDWIVHKQHGVGQINAIEKKKIGNKVRQYFRVDLSRGVYWLPTTNMPDYVRCVSTPYKFRKVFRLIREVPQGLSQDYKERDREIAERLEEATLEANGALIRDLYARRHLEGVRLSALNERQLDGLRAQFLSEMVVVLDIEMQEAENKLDKALQTSATKVESNLNES